MIKTKGLTSGELRNMIAIGLCKTFCWKQYPGFEVLPGGKIERHAGPTTLTKYIKTNDYREDDPHFNILS
jgi:hypothetical protein